MTQERFFLNGDTSQTFDTKPGTKNNLPVLKIEIVITSGNKTIILRYTFCSLVFPL